MIEHIKTLIDFLLLLCLLYGAVYAVTDAFYKVKFKYYCQEIVFLKMTSEQSNDITDDECEQVLKDIDSKDNI